MPDNKKYVELLWAEKYGKYEKGEKIPIEKPELPFQVVETINKPRIKGGYTISLFPEDAYPENYPHDWRNKLIWGDNKLVMSSLIKRGWAGKVNLIYIDPPFFTGADFTIRTKLVVSSEERGDRETIEVEKAPSIIEERAYKDTWSGGIASYLKYMYERLVLMRELLAENGSIYVHLDWHVGHYVKVMMDEIFGYENFVNEVVWWYRDPSGAIKNAFMRKHDVILLYSKNVDKHIFNLDAVRTPYKEGTIQQAESETTSFGRVVKVHPLGRHPEDVWQIAIINSQAYERLAFDTQKPETLLKRIILASSNPGDIVADFFCGSGTTLAVSEKFGRRWIGCDLSKFTIQVTRKRLLDLHNSKDLQTEGKNMKSQPDLLSSGTSEIMRQFGVHPYDWTDRVRRAWRGISLSS